MTSLILVPSKHHHVDGKCGCKKHRPGTPGSELLQQVLDAPGSYVRQWYRTDSVSGFDVVAGPGQPLSSPPLSGDILIRIIDGGSGHASVVASPGLWDGEDLTDKGFRTDGETADGFIHVSEHGPRVLEASERYARGITDRTGRLLEDLLLLRLAVPPATTIVQPPTVVRVEQPPAGSSPANPAARDEDDILAVGEMGENIELGEDLSGDPVQEKGEAASGLMDVRYGEDILEDVGVIGADDRVKITPTTDTPWRWMCHLELLDSRGRSEGHGSGVLISDRHILTAAHVVWDAAQDAHLHFIQVRPGLDYDTEPFGSWSAKRVRVCPNFVPNSANSQEWDYALVTLDKPAGTMTFNSIQNKALRYWGAGDFGGKFTMGPGEPRILVNTDVMTAGYRGNKAYGKELWLAKGRIRSMSTTRWPNSIFITADVTEGQSGSPVWVKEGDLFRLIGVIVDAGTSVNIARRVSRGMMAELGKWIAEDRETPWMEGFTEADYPHYEHEAETQIGANFWPGAIREDDVNCDHIDATQLVWADASTQQLDLMRRVYLRQVTAACQHRSFVGDVPDSELGDVEGGERLRRPAANNCRALLAAARAAMAADASAGDVSLVEVVSGYRSARRQLTNWSRNFPRYFAETQTDRTAAKGGEFGDAAIRLLTRYISVRLAAPGFSLHNDGRAVDFRTIQGNKTMGVSTDAHNRAAWRTSWFFGWLMTNANDYGFFQNTSIDEPWHWEYRGVAAAAQSLELLESAPQAFAPDTIEPSEFSVRIVPTELTIAAGRLELSNTPQLASHRGTQPDLILRWNDMTDPFSVDVVFHLHGYSSDREKMSLRRKETYSGLDFSDPNDPNNTTPGRTSPTLCILPRGSYTGNSPGTNPEQYTFPALGTPASVRDLVTYSLGQFQSSTGAGSDLSSRRFILTAHSGGGAALMRLLANNPNDELQINEIQIFDALYGKATANAVQPLVSWINRRIAAEISAWASGKGRSDSGICILYRNGTKPQSQIIRDAIRSAIANAPSDAQPVLSAAYRVHFTNVVHGQIPRQFGWRLLADFTQVFPEKGGAVESEPSENFIAEKDIPTGNAKTAGSSTPRIGGPQPASGGTSVRMPLDVTLSAQARVYEASDRWLPTGTAHQFSFSPARLAGGEWSTPPLQIPIPSERRCILEIWVSIGSASQAFFWRCDTRGGAGIKRLDPLGSQPGTVPGSPVVPSPAGDSPVLGPLTGTQTFTPTQGTIQAFGQVSGASSAIQGQLGVNLPVVPQVAGQRTTPAPQYNLTFTADLVVRDVPAALDISQHFVQFANDSSIITSSETTRLLEWVQRSVGRIPHLREAIRSGQVPVLITGKASLRGHEHHADHNLALSQHRVEAVRLLLQGTASATAGGRTQGGVLGSENVKIDAEADGDFHDTAPANIDQDRLVQISIDSAAAAAAVQRLNDAMAAP